jgi:CRISPR-associated protein, Csm3 family
LGKRQKLQETLGEKIFTEIKTENAFNRLTSRANPWKVERKPAGAEFFGEMGFHLFAKEDPAAFKALFEGCLFCFITILVAMVQGALERFGLRI